MHIIWEAGFTWRSTSVRGIRGWHFATGFVTCIGCGIMHFISDSRWRSTRICTIRGRRQCLFTFLLTLYPASKVVPYVSSERSVAFEETLLEGFEDDTCISLLTDLLPGSKSCMLSKTGLLIAFLLTCCSIYFSACTSDSALLDSCFLFSSRSTESRLTYF